jgi:hypothetical protein
MSNGKPTLNGKFIPVVELERMISIIKLAFPDHFRESL